MNETDLDHRIQEKLKVTSARKQLQHNHLQLRMLEFERRHQEFTTIADRIMQTVIRPRMEKLLQYFENARIQEADSLGKHHYTCLLEHSARFPATAKLEL